ncbi:hypothetical protein V8C37DRAFT_388268 [Trichoderma ceciliae]
MLKWDMAAGQFHFITFAIRLLASTPYTLPSLSLFCHIQRPRIQKSNFADYRVLAVFWRDVAVAKAKGSVFRM